MLQLASDKYYQLVTHRGGWRAIVKYLIDNEIVQVRGLFESEVARQVSINAADSSQPAALLFVDCAEVFFIHQRVVLQHPWIGIIHTVGGLTKTFAAEDTVEGLLANPHFIGSLQKCQLLIAHTLQLAKYLRADPRLAGIPLRVVPHPMGLSEWAPQFDLDKFMSNSAKRVILLGSQYRRVSTIYTLRTTYPKAWLPGGGAEITDRQQRFFASAMTADGWDAILHKNGSACAASGCDADVRMLNWQVDIMYTASHSEYDALVLQNIVIIDLLAASANNAVLEAISMNNPVLICKLPGEHSYYS